MIQTSEKPHVYLWYIAETKQFYLGVNWALKPYYTHSAETSKEFRSIIPHSKKPLSERMDFFENPPKGISRHILKEGTAEEMCELEHELLKNRKKRCWNRYYNNSLGDPRYVDQWGENNPMFGMTGEKHPAYKHGLAVGIKGDPARQAEYDKSPKRAARKKEYGLSPKRKKYKRDWARHKIARIGAETQGEGTLKAFLE